MPATKEAKSEPPSFFFFPQFNHPFSIYTPHPQHSTCPAQLHIITLHPSSRPLENHRTSSRVWIEMASAGVCQPGVSLAEVYVMRRLYKEKMKKARLEEDGAAVASDCEKERATGGRGVGGCFSFSRVFGKKAHHVHPSSAEALNVASPA